MIKKAFFLLLIASNLYADENYSPMDEYSHRDILKYREIIYKVPADLFLKNTVKSMYSIPPKINNDLEVRPSDIILKEDNTVSVWATMFIRYNDKKNNLLVGDIVKQNYGINCYDYTYKLNSFITYRKNQVVKSSDFHNNNYIDIIPQSRIAAVATRSCMFQSALERKKELLIEQVEN